MGAAALLAVRDGLSEEVIYSLRPECL
jgi:hypothetical protein